MREQHGRSLIEIIGVIAIGALMTAGVIAAYNTIRHRTQMTVASGTLEEIAKNTKLLMGARRNYNGVSVEYLVKSGALRNTDAPIGGADWSVMPSIDGKEFTINLTDLSRGECDYLRTARTAWAQTVIANDSDICTDGKNRITFTAK